MSATVRDVEALLSDVKREIDIARRRRIFCNRNLRMDSIELIGFDMDYTVAQYHQEKMEELSIRLTVDNLVEHAGYPAEIRDLYYDPQRAIRGIVIDCKLGNVFKMDRHGHVGRVFHGFRHLTREERRAQYRYARITLSAERYSWIDTLYALPEAVMYMTLCDYFDRTNGHPDYRQLFADIRENIDRAHRDGSLKSEILSDLSAYVLKDPDLAETLHKLRSSGKRLFLLTNSYYPYTREVMAYLLDGERRGYPSWHSYFDVIIVGGQKPGFFTRRAPFLPVHLETGEATAGAPPITQFHRGRVYQGGNIADFERMTGAMGEKVLYVGDHIFGDILRLKKSHIWRTAMVVQELERESTIGEKNGERVTDLTVLDRRHRNLESEIDYQVLILKRLQRLLDNSGDDGQLKGQLEAARQQAKATLDSLRDRVRLMREEVISLEANIDRAHNPYWGPMFREGNDNSRFGKQVSDFADLYTSRVSNFLSYSPVRYFRAPRRQMPHEL